MLRAFRLRRDRVIGAKIRLNQAPPWRIRENNNNFINIMCMIVSLAREEPARPNFRPRNVYPGDPKRLSVC